MTNYYDRDEVSRSMLATLVNDGPRTYEAYYVTKTHKPPDPTADMMIGTLTHAEVLEPDLESKIIIIPEEVLSNGAKRGNKWKEWDAAHPDVVKMKESEYETAMGAARAVRNAMWGVINHPDTVREEEFYWVHEPTGLKLRAKLDILQMSGDEWLLPDIKTCADVERFAKYDVGSRSLFLQHAMYRAAVKAKYDRDVLFWWTAVEKKGINRVAHIGLDEEASLEADRRYEALLLDLRRRHDEKDWVDPTEKGMTLVTKRQAFGWEQDER